MASIAELRSRLGNLQIQSGLLSGADAYRAQSQIRQLQNQLNAATAAQQAGQAAQAQAQSQQNANTAAQRQAEEARNKILGTAQGSIDRLQNDPTDQLLRQYLQTQMGAQTLDPNAKPFEDGAPQYTAQGIGEGQRGQAFTYDPQRMEAQKVNYRDPFDAGTVQAMVNEQAAGAGAAEAARNQLIRDAVLASGGNAFDPSLAGAQAESMSERNRAVANARNQINMVAARENAATQNAAATVNAQFGQQAGQFNAMAGNQAGQFNAANQQQASFNNAQLGQQAGMFNAGAQNQAGQFNIGNQMQAQNANFGAGRQAQMYNQQQQAAAANQLGAYNNQRQGMVYDAEGRLINVVGQQVFRGPETQLQGTNRVQLPSFQQWSGGGQSSVNYAPGYFNTTQTAGGQAGYGNPSGTAPAFAGSGKPPQGSGTTTTNFQSGYTGTPYYQQASQYVQKPGTKPSSKPAPQQFGSQGPYKPLGPTGW